MKRVLFLTAALSTLALAACGDGDPAAENAGEQTAATEDTASAGGSVPDVFDSATLPTASGNDFLTALSGMENTQVTDTGLVLQTLEEGSGAQPGPSDLAKINFVARIAGNEEPFESSFRTGEPVVVQIDQTLPGWGEALQLMKAGGKARAALPPSLAFGAQGMPGGPVGPNQVTVYDIELLDVYDATDDASLARLADEAQGKIDTYSAEAQEKQALAQQNFSALSVANRARSALFIQEQAARENTQVTDSGLVYEIVSDEGEGERPQLGDTVKVNYRGTLPSGEVFDSSYDRGQPTEFQLGQVIQGWNEGLQFMNPGDTYRFYIPAELAYGPSGTRGGPIGPNQALVFDVELLEVTPGTAEEQSGE